MIQGNKRIKVTTLKQIYRFRIKWGIEALNGNYRINSMFS